MGLRERLAAYEDPADFDDRPAAGPTAGLVSLGFIWGALRRGKRVWAWLALAGILIGTALHMASTPSPQATTTLLLVNDPSANPADVSQTSIALAQSLPVAAAVISQLGLSETPAALLKSYTVTALTGQVLQVTAAGNSSDDAVRRAAAVARQFLAFRAHYVESQQRQTDEQLAQQVSQAQRNLDSLSSQIKQIQAGGASSGQQDQLSSLKARRDAATDALAEVRQYVTSTQASTQTTAQSIVQGSQVLNAAAPVKKGSVIKGTATFAIGGLIGGLAIGMSIVIIGAITSDRLRRRDDIAYAFGAPVRLSTGPLRESRVPRLPWHADSRRRDMDRIVEHLRRAVPGSSNGPAALAVAAVDDAPTAARALVALVDSVAGRRRIVVADLSAETHAARLLGLSKPGIEMVERAGSRIAVVVPAPGDIAPVGPLGTHVSSAGYAKPDEAVARACSQADLVLTLVTLDPAIGGDHLATWATDVVGLVTAGRSTATRIHATGEMIRLAGARLSSVVVVGADKGDESLGASTEHQFVLGK
jgi:capsular polysaccharide biosynthesis protein